VPFILKPDSEKALKFVDFDEITNKRSWILFMAHGVEMNGTCHGVNFNHLTCLMLLYYLVKFETPKM